MGKIKIFLKNLTKPKTWLEPKNIFIFILVVVVCPLVFAIANKTLELLVEYHFKAPTVFVEYKPIKLLATDELLDFLAKNNCERFDQDLDDDIYTNYLLIPITIRNTSRNDISQPV